MVTHYHLTNYIVRYHAWKHDCPECLDPCSLALMPHYWVCFPRTGSKNCTHSCPWIPFPCPSANISLSASVLCTLGVPYKPILLNAFFLSIPLLGQISHCPAFQWDFKDTSHASLFQLASYQKGWDQFLIVSIPVDVVRFLTPHRDGSGWAVPHGLSPGTNRPPLPATSQREG